MKVAIVCLLLLASTYAISAADLEKDLIVSATEVSACMIKKKASEAARKIAGLGNLFGRRRRMLL